MKKKLNILSELTSKDEIKKKIQQKATLVINKENCLRKDAC
jgi:hypothetical protein